MEYERRISDLEAENKKLREDVEFYRNWKEYWRDQFNKRLFKGGS